MCIGSLFPDSESLGTKAYIYKDCKMSAKSVKFVGVGVSRPANLITALTSRVELANPVAGWAFSSSPTMPWASFPGGVLHQWPLRSLHAY